MIKTEPRERELSEAMLNIFPRIEPSREFIDSLIIAFNEEDADFTVGWLTLFKKWVMTNAGLIVENDSTLDTFRVIDNKLYTFALLRYS